MSEAMDNFTSATETAQIYMAESEQGLYIGDDRSIMHTVSRPEI